MIPRPAKAQPPHLKEDKDAFADLRCPIYNEREELYWTALGHVTDILWTSQRTQT